MFGSICGQDDDNQNEQISRRSLLNWGLGIGAASLLLPTESFAAIASAPRTLNMVNLHTGEIFRDAYWHKGKYTPDAVKALNHLMRDHRTGEVKAIDLRLFDLMYVVQKALRSSSPINIVCGYRSAKTNAALRAASDGVAQNSYHIKGQAMDLRVPGVDTRLLGLIGKKLNIGGVGFYPRSDFVHLDVGPARSWGAPLSVSPSSRATSAKRS